MRRYIGIDLHKKGFVVCYRSEAGEKKVAEYRLTEDGLDAFRETLSNQDVVAVESTGNRRILCKGNRRLCREHKGN